MSESGPLDEKQPAAGMAGDKRVVESEPREDADKSGLKAGRQPAAIEIGGPPGPEPTRYGDWERKGRCIDF